MAFWKGPVIQHAVGGS